MRPSKSVTRYNITFVVLGDHLYLFPETKLSGLEQCAGG